MAVIGTGMIGKAHAAAAISARAEIVGVGARTEESAERAAAAFGARRIYLDPEQLAADAEVEVVHVCTPNSRHMSYVVAAIASGKHVICEKPLGTSLGEAEEMQQLASEAGVVTAVPFVYRFHPMAQELRARVLSGELGPTRLVHGHYLQDWLADEATVDWRLDPVLGGPSCAFADIGSHWCDLLEFATEDQIVSVSARMHRRDGDVATNEDACSINFETAAGALGSLLVSQISAGHKNHLVIEVDGTLGSARFDQERPDVLELASGAESRTLHRGEPGLSPETRRLNLLPPGHPQGFNDAFAQFVADAYRAVAGDPPPGLPTFADGVRAAALVEAVLRSAECREPVEPAGSAASH